MVGSAASVTPADSTDDEDELVVVMEEEVNWQLIIKSGWVSISFLTSRRKDLEKLLAGRRGPQAAKLEHKPYTHDRWL
jgi:hypothetical protein